MFIQSSGHMMQSARIANDSHNGFVPERASPLGTDAITTTDVQSVKRDESAEPAAPQPTDAQIKEALNSINKTLKQSSINLQFNVDTDTKRSVIKLIDGETGDVIRQFPSEDALAISRSIDRIQQGLLLKQQA